MKSSKIIVFVLLLGGVYSFMRMYAAYKYLTRTDAIDAYRHYDSHERHGYMPYGFEKRNGGYHNGKL